MKRKALGKGLRSLIPEPPLRAPELRPSVPPTATAGSGSYPQIEVDRIRPNRRQPREEFDEAGLEALANSLKTQGLLQPIVVSPAQDGFFELVAGERRWRAAQKAGLPTIPAIVREVREEQLLELALIENLQREDLNPIEEAQAYRTLIGELGLTQVQVAERVGKQRTSVSNSLRLLSLPEPVQRLVRKGDLSMGHARALASLEGGTEQLELAERAVREGLSVREMERLVAARQAGRPAPAGPRPPLPPRDPNVAAAEQTLQRALGTKVRIVQAPSGRGRLEIYFFSGEELEGLYQTLTRPAKSRN